MWLRNSEIPMIPLIGFGVVNARDVASLHLLTMASPQAAGQRFMAVVDESVDAPMDWQILREERGERAKYVPRYTVPDLLLESVGLFDAQMEALRYGLGRRKEDSAAKAKEISEWRARSQEGDCCGGCGDFGEIWVVEGVIDQN